MHQAIAPSIEVKSDAIGARAACHLDLVFRTLTNGTGIEKNENFIRVITGEPHPMGNLAIVRNPNDPDVSEAAAQPLVDGNLPACVLYPNGVTDAVARVVVGYGFEPTSMPAMVVEIERMPATTLPPGYVFERIGARDGAAWTDAFAQGYKLPAGLARIFSPELLGADMADDASTQFFAIRRHGRLVATSLLHLADGLAGIYCVATLPDERGKGLGAHATAAALREAHELGYRVGILQSSPDGHSIYLRLGFEDRATVPMFVRMPR
jgi:GNAT superfamily N-acetyltransferase